MSEPVINHLHIRVRDLCVANGCTTRPVFGISNSKPTHCGEHKESNHVDIIKNLN